MVNRKLVRPNLAELKERMLPQRAPQGYGLPAQSPPQRENHTPGPAGAPGANQARRKQVPPDATSAEAFYYLKQMNNKTPMVVVLDNGASLRGWIEWYDRNCIKVNRDDAPNLLVFKHSIKYMFKQEEEGAKPPQPSES